MEQRKLLAEVLGTFTLVFGGCLAILAALVLEDAFLVVVAFGFGLSLLAGLYAFGEISGGHFNPAVSLGFFLSGRLSAEDMIGYWIAQIIGALLAGLMIVVAFDSDAMASTATQTTDVWRAVVLEFLLTMIFVAVILQSSRSERVYGTALIAIPLTLVAIHLAAVPFSGASVNPARSIASAVFGTEWSDLWIYILIPPLGAAAAAFVHRFLYPPEPTVVEVDVVEVRT